jgi:hypothetical protein
MQLMTYLSKASAKLFIPPILTPGWVYDSAWGGGGHGFFTTRAHCKEFRPVR